MNHSATLLLLVSATAMSSQLDISAFPHQAIAFIERELPNVQLAVAQKDRNLLEPVLTRSREFLNRWGLDSPSAPALDHYAACASAVADVVREGAVELSDAPDAERARVHEEFQVELAECRKSIHA